eukprot:CAMPEP_0177641830 /NCGR_PEP_ID=MMETSP0447-20121125/7269_1 /TAXON_ID=0 /ORGANISM="Stygamoeba regulata, Strain BSH-02190019" /LENGTH=321 /DNA_ID=CAMNT_0019143961 /DNA_START=51 /DNA_END=1016 /DNA_ORIENTATION=+
MMEFDPTLKNIIDKRSLKWIFVGGKGGVGKTTTSSSLAVQLSQHRENVLIISTDPAHNLSDAFNQKFSKTPQLVNGFTNLFAMEIDPTVEEEQPSTAASTKSSELGMIQELAMSIPGIDEAMSFAEVLRLVKSMEFETVVFDTAPTGHTLRLLTFPSVLEKGMGKLSHMRGQMSGILSQLSSMMGSGMNIDDMQAKIESTQAVIEEVNKQFKDPALTTFVCVCIPEFLSIFETERLVQELYKFEMDTQNIVINQVLYPDPDCPCKLCLARAKMQQTYIDQVYELYDLFHVVKMPLLPYEIRGVDQLKEFSKMLVEGHTPGR